MTQDASFDDGREAPVNLGALDEDDLKVLSSLVQDAVFPITEMRWRQSERRFALLVNRFRWEDEGQQRHGPERVQSLLVADNVLKISSQGVDRQEKDMVLSILSVEFEAAEDGAGHDLITQAGDGAIRLEVEALELTLKDVTRPYRAPSGKAPTHDA
jgi:hypothetical protein